jgi:hypothetical protein
MPKFLSAAESVRRHAEGRGAEASAHPRFPWTVAAPLIAIISAGLWFLIWKLAVMLVGIVF